MFEDEFTAMPMTISDAAAGGMQKIRINGSNIRNVLKGFPDGPETADTAGRPDMMQGRIMPRLTETTGGEPAEITDFFD